MATILFSAVVPLIFCSIGISQTLLKPDEPSKFTLAGKEAHDYLIDLREGDVCNISTTASAMLPVLMQIKAPGGVPLVKDGDPAEGFVFVAHADGSYSLTIKAADEYPDNELAKYIGTQVTVKYSNKFELPRTAATKAVRNINGYQARISDESGDEGKTYFIVTKNGKIKAVMRAEKEMTGGFYFSDDPSQSDGANAKRSAMFMRTVVDKTGDGTPDVAVEYYTGGAHCCFEITFFELGPRVRQLPTIATDNDRMTAIGRKPGGGLRFQFTEQAFAYWNINFAQSPMPIVIYEFDKSDNLVPRFDLMRKPPPTLAKLRRDAAAMKSKINLNSYTSPEDNFNDWEEPFWAEMLDLIYSGHEELAWQYFDLVWPARKPGKAKFVADFKEQLSLSTYGVRKPPD